MKVFAIGRTLVLILTAIQIYLWVVGIGNVVRSVSGGLGSGLIFALISLLVIYGAHMCLQSIKGWLEAIKGFWVKSYNVNWLQNSTDKMHQGLWIIGILLGFTFLFMAAFFLLGFFNANTLNTIRGMFYGFGLYPLAASTLKIFSVLFSFLILGYAFIGGYTLLKFQAWCSDISNALKMGSNLLSKRVMYLTLRSINTLQIATIIISCSPLYLLLQVSQLKLSAFLYYVFFLLLGAMLVFFLHWFKEYIYQLYKNIRSKSVTVYNTLG